MSHDQTALDALREDVLARRLNRRSVLKRAAALGLSAPVVASLLAACGGDDDDDDADGDGAAAEPTATTGAAQGEATEPMATEEEEEAEETPAEGDEATPTEAEEAEETPEATAEDSGGGERGGGGQLRLLWWQAPTILNSHYSQGTKDYDASRLVLEPLADVADDGTLIPFLAAEIPSLENGMVSEDGTSVTWTLREGVTWHDGEPFTSADVRFTYEWIISEGNVTTTLGSYEPIESVETPDDYTVVVNFRDTTPGWFDPFVGDFGRIIPEHIMSDYMGAEGQNAPFNLEPIGTGPYIVEEFRPGDVVSYVINENYWDSGKPYFDEVEMKGGGDATSAARAALQTGETDYAWNLQVEAEILTQLEESGNGVLLTPEGLGVERILINMTDPNTEVDGERSVLGNPHPFLSDVNVRQALTYACDRDTIATQLYGPTGEPTSNWLVGPEAFVSTNTSYEFNLDTAAQMLDEAGWTMEDGQRQQDGVQMSILYQTSVNSVRQKTQEIIKAAFEEIGIPVEIKAIEASVFFSSDAGNPDTAAHFYADFEMYTNNPGIPYPLAYAQEGLSRNPETDIPQQSNNWSGDNYMRWQNEEYNEAYSAAEIELEPDRQAELFITMNDLMVNEVAQIPLVQRTDVSAHVADLDPGERSRWTSELWNIADWRRTS